MLEAAALVGRDGEAFPVGTGVAALALALAAAFPHAEPVGIDVSQRVLDLARTELAEADPAVASRITLRLEDVGTLDEHAAYDLIWLPAPFLSEASLESAIPASSRRYGPAAG